MEHLKISDSTCVKGKHLFFGKSSWDHPDKGCKISCIIVDNEEERRFFDMIATKSFCLTILKLETARITCRVNGNVCETRRFKTCSIPFIKLCSWFPSYLFEWRRPVVPQGLVLEPMLFLLNINDLFSSISYSIHTYADNILITLVFNCLSLYPAMNWIIIVVLWVRI